MYFRNLIKFQPHVLATLATVLVVVPAPLAHAQATALWNDGFAASENSSDVDFLFTSRQSGALSSISYVQSPAAADPLAWHHQVGNSAFQNRLLLAGDGEVLGRVSPNYNFKSMVSGALPAQVSFKLQLNADNTSAYTTAGFSLGSSSPQTPADAATPHFGIRFTRDDLFGAGSAMQFFDGSTWIGNQTYTFPGGIDPGAASFDVCLIISDPIDGNPWNGVSSTHIAVSVNGTLVGSYSKDGGGYTDNFLTMESGFGANAPAATPVVGVGINVFDELTVSTAPPVNEEFSTAQLTYAGDVSTADLLHGVAPVTSGNWGSDVASLNDGVNGGPNGGSIEGAWTRVGAAAEFNLGLGANGLGYDIGSIQAIAGWDSGGFGFQAWKVEVKPVGGSYVYLATVDYQPSAIRKVGASKVILGGSGGLLASRIQSIRFTANPVASGFENSFIWREIDVFGLSTVPDLTAPALMGLYPRNEASGAPANSKLELTFDENVTVGTGDITIKNLSDSTQMTIAVSDGSQVSMSGPVMKISPVVDLTAFKQYAIQIDATAIKDRSGNAFSGISDDMTWKFITGLPDLAAPATTTLSPTDGITGVSVGTNLVATFDENVTIGSGNITIKNLSTSTEIVIPVGDSRVSLAGSVLTINPNTDLDTKQNYAVRIDSGAFVDRSGNPFPGILNDTTWNFTSEALPLRILCVGDSITVGYTDDSLSGAYPFMFGYRRGLYTQLTSANYDFKLVGSSPQPDFGSYVPPFNLRDFGQDGHEGYGGETISGLTTKIAGYMASAKPDVILLMIGINEMGPDSPALLNTLVNRILTSDPTVRLIVAQITPRAEFNQDLYNYNLYIRDTLVPTYAGSGSHVSTVDQYSLFLTDPNNYTSAIKPGVMSNGINHPTNPYYDLMAPVWLQGIEALGFGPNFTSWIADPAFGLDPANQGFALDPDGDGLPNGVEAWFGSNPAQSNPGLSNPSKSFNHTTFTHPQTANPLAGLSGDYEWSPNLIEWYQGGSGPAGGPTVTFSSVTTNGITTLTATASAPMAKQFLHVKVSQATP